MWLLINRSCCRAILHYGNVVESEVEQFVNVGTESWRLISQSSVKHEIAFHPLSFVRLALSLRETTGGAR
jgi:hypothetical protein